MMARAALALVFLSAAALKAEYYLLSKGARLEGSAMESDLVISAVIALELGIAVGMFTKMRAAAAYGAIAIAITGLYVGATDKSLAVQACSCLGRVRLSGGAHVLLSLGVLVLASRVVLDAVAGRDRRAQARRTSHAPRP